ncbi:MAG: hypothetical protein AMJ69_13130 [Gammaproteobacteria bacterium SG8_47]|nr:MAG: hypothetical protein AMJ69_13130 [Gammaproteobacteria bacterium SG8_47]
MGEQDWLTSLSASLVDVLNSVIVFAPRLLAAVALLLAGWLVARLLRMLITRLIASLDRLWHGFILRSGLEHLQARHPPAKVIGAVVFWLTLLFFLTAATEVLGLGVFVTWLSQVVAYLPVLVAGVLIVLAGFVVSSLVRDLVAATAASAGFAQGDLLGRSAQVVILLVAVVIGVDQIGIDITFLSIMAGIVLAATLGGVALAFGLGARNHVANIIAAHQVRQLYRVGDTIELAGHAGRVAEVTATRVILVTSAGRVAQSP